MWSFLGLDPFRRTVLLRGVAVVVATVLASSFGTTAAVLAGLAVTIWSTWEVGRRADPLRRSVLRLALESDRAAELDLEAGLLKMAATVSRARTLLDDARRRAERERDDVRGILEAATDAILVIGAESKVQLINDAGRLLLKPAGDPLGQPLSHLIENRQVLAFASQLRDGDDPAPVRLQLGDDEDARFLRLTGAVIRSSPQRQRVVLVLHDLTGLEYLQQVRTDFVANVTHEMRSPLASILGYAETLSDTPGLTDEEVEDALRRILRNARRLDDIIRDLIELSRLEHTTRPETTPTDVAALVHGCVQSFQDLAKEKGVQLEEEVSSVQGLLALDSGLVHQALTNLVENGIKYTPEGGTVRVTGRFVDHAPATADGTPVRTLELSVADTGPGIPAEHHGRIFERFYRVDTARSRALGGTGLGLAIVKHAAVVHGGSVQLESEPGEGTVFRLLLPLGEELVG